MIAVKVSDPWKAVVVGAPSYLARRGEPATPDDLAAHDCVQYRLDGALFPWPFVREGTRRKIAVHGPRDGQQQRARAARRDRRAGPRLRSTIPWPSPSCAPGQLVAVLADWSPSFDGYFLIYSGRRQVPSALRALIDMLRAQRTATRGPTDPGMVFPGTLAKV